MSIEGFLLDLWLNIVDFWDNLFELPFYLGLGGRIIFSMCFLVYWKWDPTPQIKRETSVRFWVQFGLKECLLVVVSMLNLGIAAAICFYSTLKSGSLLQMVTRNQSPRIRFTTKIFAALLNPIFSVVGLGFIIGYYIAGDVTLFETLIAPTGIALYFIWTKFIQTPSTQGDIAAEGAGIERSTPKWTLSPKVTRVIKIAVVACLVAVPLSLYGLFYSHLFSSFRTYEVEMPDGVTLQTYVYLPPNYHGEKRPVILYRTPYNAHRDDVVKSYMRQYVTRQGFVLVTQDLRGNHDSGGDFYYFLNESVDGVATMAWILKQSWCNGKVATIGGSADATNQYYYQAEGPTGLVSGNMMMGSPELYDHWFFPGGCFRWEFGVKWMSSVGAASQIPYILAHAAKDDTWDPVSVGTNGRATKVNLRAVHIGGWYDCFQQGTLDGFQYYNYQGTEYARGHQVLIIGPWAHSFNPVHEDVTYPENQGANLSSHYQNLLFGEGLLGETVDWTSIPRVHYYVMGDPDAEGSGVTFNVWRTSNDWPLPGVSSEMWYFHQNGTFSRYLPVDLGGLSYRFDPTDPVLNRGGTSLFLDHLGGCDQRAVEVNRSNILAFNSSILSTPVEICGRIRATLAVSSNCTDTDFAVKLIDVFPDGREMWVASGILKTRYREGFAPGDVEFITPGQVYELDVDMWSTAYRFVPGHKIKVSVTSSDYPKFAVNPNTGAPVHYEFTEYNVANNTVWCGQTGMLSGISFPRTL